MKFQLGFPIDLPQIYLREKNHIISYRTPPLPPAPSYPSFLCPVKKRRKVKGIILFQKAQKTNTFIKTRYLSTQNDRSFNMSYRPIMLEQVLNAVFPFKMDS